MSDEFLSRLREEPPPELADGLRRRLGGHGRGFRLGEDDRVLVVDDVMTTGATVAEISRVLRRSGARRIEVWAVARTPND